MNAPTVAIETLGCKLNQYESEAIATELQERGYRVVPFGEDAEVYVINGCTVTSKADRKTRNLVNRALRTRRGGSGVIVTGCFVDGHPDEKTGEDSTYYVDNTRKHAIPEIVEAHLRGEGVDLESLAGDVFGFAPPGRIFHTRTTIKIQDGCDNFCTFCIIPFVRGRARSRDPGEIVREAAQAIEGGARELILTGVNMSRYRWDESGEIVDFSRVVRRILDLDGDFRVRISSLEPDQLNAQFIELFRHPRIAPHLHLCLQSASPRILLAMRRMYTIEQYRETVTALREIDPLFNITTDLIVGFPGETAEDQAAAIAAIAEHGFGHVHTFPYSRRSGTRAERMPGQINEQTRKVWAEQIRLAAEAEKRSYRKRFVGRIERVLVERVMESGCTVYAEGFGEHYVPIRVRIEGSASVRPNTFINVFIETLEAGNDPRLTGALSQIDG